jgi:hypothetical protein
MIHTTYKNFSLQPQSELDKYIHSNSERQFFFTESKNIIDKYLYHQNKKQPNRTSLTSTHDGDPVIFFVDGDYTIPAGTTITPTNRCKGLYMFINGTLTNNGTISMTARGANAEGRFVSIDADEFFHPTIRYDIENTFRNILP